MEKVTFAGQLAKFLKISSNAESAGVAVLTTPPNTSEIMGLIKSLSPEEKAAAILEMNRYFPDQIPVS